jgi:hypothetical protein
MAMPASAARSSPSDSHQVFSRSFVRNLHRWMTHLNANQSVQDDPVHHRR